MSFLAIGFKRGFGCVVLKLGFDQASVPPSARRKFSALAGPGMIFKYDPQTM